MANGFYGSAYGATGVTAQLAQQQEALKRRVVETPNENIPYASFGRVQGSCGVGLVHTFNSLPSKNYPNHRDYVDKNIPIHGGGCGFLMAAFIDTPECKAIFDKLKKYPILYQSPIRFNQNSNHNFFFCIFDTGERGILNEYKDDEENIRKEAGFPNGLQW